MVYCVKLCIFWDIALISVCIWLSQFRKLKSRPHLIKCSCFYAVNNIYIRLMVTYTLSKNVYFWDNALVKTYKKCQKYVCRSKTLMFTKIISRFVFLIFYIDLLTHSALEATIETQGLGRSPSLAAIGGRSPPHL